MSTLPRAISLRLILFSVFLAFLVPAKNAGGQCCSTGCPLGSTDFSGVLGRNTLRVSLFYRHSYSDTYYHDDHETDENTALKEAYYNFTGMTVGYGITRRLTAELELGYFFDKTQILKYQDYKNQGYGLSNGSLNVKYGAFIKPAQAIEVTAGAGFRFPFTFDPQQKNNVQLNRDVQPSTNAFGLSGILFLNKGFPSISLKLFSMNRFDYNFEDKKGYQYGSILMNSLSVSKKVIKNGFVVLQFRSEWKQFDAQDGEVTADTKNTGYYLLTLTPAISYAIAGKWNISLQYDLPLYKNYNGKQLTPKYAFAVSLTRDFRLRK